MAKKITADIPTVWRLFECEKGRRWSEVAQASYCPDGEKRISKTGDVCQFSGCLQDHRIRAVRDTTDPPTGWFLGWPDWEKTPRYRSLT